MKIIDECEEEGSSLGSCCARALFFIFYGQPANCFQSIEFMCVSCRRTYEVLNVSHELNRRELTIKAVGRTEESLNTSVRIA